jgi:hypothetical protein
VKVAKARKLVGHFKHSTIATQALNELQENMLIQDCPTRWNSTYYKLERLLSSRRAITDVMLNEDKTKPGDKYLLLKDDDCEIIEELLPALKPIEVATTALSSEQHVLVSMLYPIILGLTNVHLKMDQDDKVIVKKLKDVIRNSLILRFRTNTKEVCKTMPLIASALDLRF